VVASFSSADLPVSARRNSSILPWFLAIDVARHRVDDVLVLAVVDVLPKALAQFVGRGQLGAFQLIGAVKLYVALGPQGDRAVAGPRSLAQVTVCRYTPGSKVMVSPGFTSATAFWMVARGLSPALPSLASLPPGWTKYSTPAAGAPHRQRPRQTTSPTRSIPRDVCA